jgi:hypothetical protein
MAQTELMERTEILAVTVEALNLLLLTTCREVVQIMTQTQDRKGRVM